MLITEQEALKSPLYHGEVRRKGGNEVVGVLDLVGFHLRSHHSQSTNTMAYVLQAKVTTFHAG